jgi:peptidylprolyl isomerase
MRPRPVCITLALLVALAAAGCGGDDEAADSNPDQGQDQAETTETSPAAAAKALKDTSLRPEVPRPVGSPPRRLETENIVKGKGPPARRGDTVVVKYVGVTFSTGEEFDTSWDIARPYRFPLGRGEVIEGWDKGIVGMREGGRRKLTIPPELAYGADGSPPDVPPNETLVYVIDLVRIQEGS